MSGTLSSPEAYQLESSRVEINWVVLIQTQGRKNKGADKALHVGGNGFMSNVYLKQLSILLNGILPR